MRILSITLATVLGLGLGACTAEVKQEGGTPAVKKDAGSAKKDAGSKVAMTEQKLELDKVP